MTDSIASSLRVAPDLADRLTRYRRVEMPFSSEGLTPRERDLVHELVAACQEIEKIFWRQSDPAAIELHQRLATSSHPEDDDLRRFLWINGGRFDLLDEHNPFVGDEPYAPGHALYPKGATAKEIEDHLAAHPDQKPSFHDGRTVIRRGPAGLRTVPYHEEYRPLLERAVVHLRAAASHADEEGFANFLRMRADALLTDDYYESDLAWVRLEQPKFDLILGPYETYLDDLLGVKTSYGAAVLIRDDEESRKLSIFQRFVPEIQEALPLPAEDRPSKRGHAMPMEVMSAPFRSGDVRHGYQAVAQNLPNDRRIHEEVGSKKIFFRNFMEARVEQVVLPLARLLVRKDQADLASTDGYLAFVMMHEIAHGIGPAMARRGGERIDIRTAMGPVFSRLEEAKADVTGLFALRWLVNHGHFAADRLEACYASWFAGIFRTVRFGAAEAHSAAELMQFNVLSEMGAVDRDPASGRYAYLPEKLPAAVEEIMKELLEQEATGDRARTEAWFERYGTMPDHLRSALAGTAGIPVDIDPVVSFAEPIE